MELKAEWTKNTDVEAETNSYIATMYDDVKLEVFSSRDGKMWAYNVSNGEDKDTEHGYTSMREAQEYAETAAKDFKDGP